MMKLLKMNLKSLRLCNIELQGTIEEGKALWHGKIMTRVNEIQDLITEIF